MKILWHSNAPWAPTGYGQQTALFVPRLREHHDVFISANYALEAAPIIWQGIPVFPGVGGDHGNGTITGHAEVVFGGDLRGGIVLTLYDAVVWNPDVFGKLNAVCWAPVDHNPAPPALLNFFRTSQAIPMAMSQYGADELAEFEPLYCPHAVDTSVFKPTESDVRERMGVPQDAFLIGMVAANKGHSPSRKSFQQAFEAFGHLLRKHDDAYLYLHTQLAPGFAQGESILDLLAALGIPSDRVKFPNQYSMIHAPADHERLAALYTALDVLLNPSMGGGFEIAPLEAQACGTPVIVSDFTAMPEVCGAGWKVGGRPWWTAQHSFMAVPDVPEIVEALVDCYELTEAKRRSLSVQARQFAQRFDIDHVLSEYMLPALAEAEARIGNLAPVKVAAA